MAGDLAEDDSLGTSPEEGFKINTFFVIVNRAIQTTDSCFVQHKKSQESLPPKALKKIGELLMNIDEEKLEGLISFMNVWPHISNVTPIMSTKMSQ